jgi:hypothetical protein
MGMSKLMNFATVLNDIEYNASAKPAYRTSRAEQPQSKLQ